jgi:thiol-disulfide isomerase/thioredoxin
MLALLLAAARGFEQAILQLTTSSFRRLVQNRRPHEVWLVMFSGPNCPACSQALPRFNNASRIASGMIRFAVLDTQRAPEIANEFDIRALPTFRVFHSRGDADFVGKRKERDFVNEAASYLEDLSAPVERSWLDSMLSRPSAMLFTDKPKTPPIWAGISTAFHGKSIRIGTSKEDPDMRALYNVSRIPSVLFMNGTLSKVYKGKIAFIDLKEAIETFFERRLKIENQTVIEGDFAVPADFEASCLGGRQNCILYVGKNPHKILQQLATRYAKHTMRWFVGVKDLPFPFMEAGGVWVYNPRRDGFLHVPEIEELPEALDRVLDGSAKWKSKASFSDTGL